MHHRAAGFRVAGRFDTASWGYVRLHRLDYDEPMLAEWAKQIAAQAWNDAYVFFKHDEGIGSGPPAVTTFVRLSV